jgi:formamidopyrimidine-DNA glycosylase
MPELPEVEAIRLKLDQVLRDRKISKIDLLREKSFPHFDEKSILVLDKKIIGVKRRAKVLNFVFENDYSFLAHLKMTGQFIFRGADGEKIGGGHPTADWVNELPSKHTRIIFNFDDGSKMFFNDMRVFGWVKVFKNQELVDQFAHLGPDILSEAEIEAVYAGDMEGGKPDFDLDYLMEKAKRRTVSIKQFIMNNQVICGVGNIYASEALFDARLSPIRPASKVKKKEMRKLLASMKKIVKQSVLKGGTTFDGKYVGVDGFAGGFQNDLNVYGQTGEACPVCGAKIERIKQGGRSTFYCPICQK